MGSTRWRHPAAAVVGVLAVVLLELQVNRGFSSHQTFEYFLVP